MIKTNITKVFFQLLFPAVIITKLFAVFYVFSYTQKQDQDAINFSTPPDFASINIISKRKKSFLDFITPIVNAENSRILQIRERIKLLQKNFYNYNHHYSTEDSLWLEKLAAEYGIETSNTNFEKLTTQLLHKIDIIPGELAIAQAAMESAWGTSRFAQKGNNFFGQWCFEINCGIPPQNPQSDKKHYEVRKFSSANLSVRSYMKNLNTHRAYRKLRKIRANVRTQYDRITGAALLGGLRHYSAMGDAYAVSLHRIIKHNGLEKLFQKSF